MHGHLVGAADEGAYLCTPPTSAGSSDATLRPGPGSMPSEKSAGKPAARDGQAMADIKRREFITLLGGAAHGLLRRARNRRPCQ
jgi:hypothetical protein